MRKEKIINQKRELAEWVLIFKQLPDNLWFKPFKEGSWGTAEVISHFLHWDQFVIDNRLIPFLRNEQPPQADVTVDRLNETAAVLARSMNKEDLIDLFVNIRKELTGYLQEMPEEAFAQKVPGKSITWNGYFQGLIEHDERHKKQIDEHLKDSIESINDSVTETDILMGKDIYLKELSGQEVMELLRLQKDNKEFFEAFSMDRAAGFYTVEGQKERIRQFARDKENDHAYHFGIYLSREDRLIGTINLFQVLRGSLQSAFIGYFLDHGHNGRGYATEAAKLIVQFGFAELRLHRIEAGVMPHNVGSIRVLEKSGFQKEGIARKNVRINGKWEDHQVLAIINPADE
ncbi:GNAT family N-acetyltransferase [Bacillus salacetis]|uniref:GNAT family N-acetyltransferase n=1 Tax=Bacillus salacetis TaxID=2315464 RepID=A0A3A1RAT6_9BACI|nr:GNAT family N-acetyltransferase [Bacillus salacetis]